MSAHRINRATIELGVDDAALGTALIERLSQLHARIAAAIDHVCDEASDPGRIDRIDVLELELGTLPLASFGDEFIRALTSALRSVLARQLGSRARADGETDVQAALELLATFARTGNLPWWAEADHPEPIARQARVLLRAAPERWWAFIRELAADSERLRRVLQQLDDDALEATLKLFPDGPAVLAQLHGLARLLGARWSRELKRAACAAVLREGSAAAGRHGHGLAPRGRLLRAALAQLTPRSLTGLSESPLWAVAATEDLREAVFEALAADGGDAPSADEPRGVEPSSNAPARSDAAGAEAMPLTAAADRLFPASVLRSGAASESGLLPAIAAESARTRLPAPKAEQTSAPSPQLTATTLLPAAPLASVHASHPDVPLDELYVDDAGLVLLWPFLERFFERLDLLDNERAFRSEPARMRGVALLSLLALEDLEPPEHRLALPKLLCGLLPDAYYVAGPAITPEQCEEGEHLLSAIIDHAPILHGLQPRDFRSSFLARRGMLTIDHGAWLLHVEPAAHDVVLEQLPWPRHWLKLPWMPEPLRVQW